MKKPQNFKKIEQKDYLINGARFDIRLADNSSDINEGDSGIWFSGGRFPNTACFVFEWDESTYGCRAELRFCKAEGGLKGQTVLKIFMDPKGFKTPDTLREHMKWLLTKHWNFLTN